MKTPECNLQVCVDGEAVWIKVVGRANINCSVDLKMLVNELSKLNYHLFRLDLKECLLMDSTFLGVLAAMGIKVQQKPTLPLIELLNPNERISGLLENLGVLELFEVIKDAPVEPNGNYRAQPSVNPSPMEKAQTSVESHKLLSSLNPENEKKFKHVLEFLTEDLKRMGKKQPRKPPEDEASQEQQ